MFDAFISIDCSSKYITQFETRYKLLECFWYLLILFILQRILNFILLFLCVLFENSGNFLPKVVNFTQYYRWNSSLYIIINFLFRVINYVFFELSFICSIFIFIRLICSCGALWHYLFNIIFTKWNNSLFQLLCACFFQIIYLQMRLWCQNLF